METTVQKRTREMILSHSDAGKKTEKSVGDILKTFNKEQMDVLNYLVYMAMNHGNEKDKAGEKK